MGPAKRHLCKQQPVWHTGWSSTRSCPYLVNLALYELCPNGAHDPGLHGIGRDVQSRLDAGEGHLGMQVAM
eukprot:scaffold173428_cov22-Tisochrysis_lutea.AAC.1